MSVSLDCACFVTSFVLEGIQRCSGIFFSWTLDQSEESRQRAAIPFVVSRATAYIVSVVCKDFLRNEKTEISLQCGVFLGILGAALSFISSDLVWLTICWGIIFGAGIGISSPEPLKVSQKFRTQPFLFLIRCAAPSFACILLPYFLQFLLSCYGLCGCLLIVSGITLNAAPFIMVASYRIRFLLRRPLWRIRKKYEISDIERNQAQKSSKNGIDNECFEIDSFHKSDRSAAVEDARVVERNAIPNSIVNNSDIFPVEENSSCSGIIPDFSKKTASLANKDFEDEDVLFEITSNVLRDPTSSKGGEDDFENETLDSEGGKIPYRRRKDTMVDPYSKKNAFQNNANTVIQQINALDKSMPNAILLESIKNPPQNGLHILRNKLSDPPTIHTSSNGHSIRTELVMKSQPKVNNYPLEIKVHVVECTFTEDDVRDGRLLSQSVRSYRRHSNSLITSQYNNFSPPNFSKVYNKPSNLYGRSSHPPSNMYLISEDEELAIDTPRSNPTTALRQSAWKKIFKPACLVIIYAFVIHEVTLVTLLTIFDDHIDGLVLPATGVLPAYGLGGILGRLSVRYWGDRLLLEGSHATAALLFILHGVVVAGVLWSPNIYWIGGFYASVGFLEIGISTAVWNLVHDHIEVEVKSVLFTTCKLLCGICALFVPYTIGLSRDVMEEYDGLLQITSGLSVLCSLLCYILPKFTFHIRHVRGS